MASHAARIQGAADHDRLAPRHIGHEASPAGLHGADGVLDVRRIRPHRFHGPEKPVRPCGKALPGRDPSGQMGQFQMGMCIDQAGNQRHGAQVMAGAPAPHLLPGPDRQDAAVFHHDSAVLDHGALRIHGQNAGGTVRPHHDSPAETPGEG